MIAIFAAISIVAYNGIQARANDAKIKAAVKQLETAMIIWSNDNGNVIKGGSGSVNPPGPSGCDAGSGGWFAASYNCRAEDTLVASGVIPTGFTASFTSQYILWQ